MAAKSTTKFAQDHMVDPTPARKLPVTKYNNYDDDPKPLLSNAWFANRFLEPIGKPDEITVVVLPGHVKVKSVTLE
jgi:hypothetical protein